jgi:hypothetical protein
MRTGGWLAGVVLTFGVTALLAGPGDTQPGTSPERIQDLIDRLGSSQFREREAAGRELDALGGAALDALRKAAGAGDPETRRRATELAERIDTRLTAARLLTPTIVQLDYKDTPLAAAVNDLAKRTGAPIKLASTDAFAGRTVTVVSGPLPFWEALELFSRQAGLHEREDPFYREEIYKTVIIGQAMPNGGNVVQRRAVFIDANTAANPSPAIRPFTLIDGPDTAGPADPTRSVRVRVSSTGAPSRVPNRGDDSIIPLHVSAEPRLLCPGACDVRITRAIDDQGQSLAASAVRPAADTDVEELIFMANGALVPQWSPARPGPIAVRLKRGAKASKSLREFTGTVTTQLYVSDVVATLDRPAAAVGTTVSGENDVTLKLTDWSRHVGGEVRVTVEVQMPQVGVSAPAALRAQLQFRLLAQLQPWGGVVNRQGLGNAASPMSPASGTDYEGLSLEDSQGRRLPVVGGSQEVKSTPQGYVTRILASFRAEPDAEPARLVLTLPRPVLVDVPFTLKDVPLP